MLTKVEKKLIVVDIIVRLITRVIWSFITSGYIWLFTWIFNPNVDSGVIWLIGVSVGLITFQMPLMTKEK